jgi:hypothetical protein
MSRRLPKYDNPPVKETLLGVQFDPLPRLYVAHLAAFLGGLGEAWQAAPEVPAIGQAPPPELGEQWAGPAFRLQVAGPADLRLRAIDGARDRLLQLENGWMVVNWRELRAGAKYPDYQQRKGEFAALFQMWVEFVRAHGLGEMSLNMWEVSYVNFIDREPGVWTSVPEWHGLLPGLLGPMSLASAGPLQTLEGRWRYAIGVDSHLQIDLQHRARTLAGEDETLLERLVARGPIDRSRPETMAEGFDQGHEAIVLAFGEVASDSARKRWGYRP